MKKLIFAILAVFSIFPCFGMKSVLRLENPIIKRLMLPVPKKNPFKLQ